MGFESMNKRSLVSGIEGMNKEDHQNLVDHPMFLVRIDKWFESYAALFTCVSKTNDDRQPRRNLVTLYVYCASPTGVINLHQSSQNILVFSFG